MPAVRRTTLYFNRASGNVFSIASLAFCGKPALTTGRSFNFSQKSSAGFMDAMPNCSKFFSRSARTMGQPP